MLRLLESFLAASPDLVFAKDLERRFVFANLPTAQALRLTSPDELLGRREEDLAPGGEADGEIEREERQLFRDMLPVRRTASMAGPDGAAWYSLVKTAYRDPAGDVTGLIGIGRDITGLKNAVAVAEANRLENDVFRRLIDALPDMVFAKDTEGRFIVANTATANLMNAESAEALTGETDFSFYPADIAKRFRSDEVEFMKSGKQQIMEQPVQRPDGSRGYLCSLKVPMVDDGGKLIGYVGHGRDVTDTRLAEHALRQREADLAQAQVLGHTGSLSWRMGTSAVSCSAGMGALLGLPSVPETRSARDLLRRVLPEDRAGVLAAVRAASNTPEPADFRFRIRRENGEFGVIHAILRQGRNFEGQPMFFGACHDITEREHAEQALHRMAFSDPLTGLANRAALTESLERHLSAGAQPERHLSLLLIDLDGFKQINDTLGHLAGDEVLGEVAARLRGCTRNDELIGRLGGDEFAIVLEHAPGRETPAKVARRCVAAMRQPFEIEGEAASIGASIGIVTSTDRSESISQLLSRADRALYRAKREGRDGYRFYDPDRHRGSGRAPGIAGELRQALDLGEIVPHYQIQVDAGDNRVVGLEALARWHHRSRGIIGPADFIGVAERSSMIGDLGKCILDKACRQLRAWIDDGWNPGTMSVNVSVVQLWHIDLASEVTAALVRHRLAPPQLVLEFTESVFIQHDKNLVRNVLGTLADMGVVLAIDDFGAGSSGLGYITELPFARVKIDRSYVTGASSDDKRAALLRGIVQMVRAVGMEATAEGVETAADAELTRAIGCQAVQGYFFGKPQPPEAFAIPDARNAERA